MGDALEIALPYHVRESIRIESEILRFQPGQSVQLTASGGAGIGELRLRARVMNQSAVEEGKLQLYRAGLRFEHPTRDLQDIVSRLLQKLTSRQALTARQWKSI